MRLLVCSLEDRASINIKDALLSEGKWTRSEEICGLPTLRMDDMIMVTIQGPNISADGIDDLVADIIGRQLDDVIFLSRHRAASRRPSLTVHPIGNWGIAALGGRDGDLVNAAPDIMTSLLRKMKVQAKDIPFEVTFEVTHHGPYIKTPALFIEIGSDESMWENMDAANVLAKSLICPNMQCYPHVIGIGGGHYAPRYTDMALSKKVSFGHMIPSYAMGCNGAISTYEMISMALEKSCSSLAYIHKGSINEAEEANIEKIVKELGAEVIRGSDLDSL